MSLRPADRYSSASGTLHKPPSTAVDGLRERQKKQTRQLISDTATAMFLTNGFDSVRVVDVAAACGVSEKTIYNHFPTKESLIFDRFDDMEGDIRQIFGAANESPVVAAVRVIVTRLEAMFDESDEVGRLADPALIRRFSAMIQQSPALRAAQWEMHDQMTQLAAAGIAIRVGLDLNDPEPQIAASAIVGLWRIQYRSMVRNATDGRPALEVRDAVIADVRRAAELIDSGLSLFVRRALT